MRVAVAVVVAGAVVGRCSFRADSREAAKLRTRLDRHEGFTLIKAKSEDDAARLPRFVRFEAPRHLPAEGPPAAKPGGTGPRPADPRQLDLFGCAKSDTKVRFR